MMIPLRSCILGFLLLFAAQPGSSWYKHSASPRYHTVGRASGLLIGVRRSPYLWKRDSFPLSHQGAGEWTGEKYGPWEGAGSEHQLYPDPGENRSLVEKLQSEIMERGQEEKRGPKVKGAIHDEKSRSLGGWRNYKELGEERSLGGQSWVSKYPGYEERNLGEQRRVAKYQRDEEGTLGEQSWVTKHPRGEERTLGEQSWVTKHPGDEERTPGAQSWVTKYPGDEERTLGEQSWVTKYPGDEERSLGEQSWLTKHPGDEVRTMGESLVTKYPGDEERTLGLQSWMTKHQGGDERNRGRQSWVTQIPGDEDSSMVDNLFLDKKPGEDKRTFEGSWVTKQPSDVPRAVESWTPEREMRTAQEQSGQRRRPSRGDILSMLLKMTPQLQAESRSLPWTTQTRADNQALYPKSKAAEWTSCDDFTLATQKALCLASLRSLSHSQPQPQEAEA